MERISAMALTKCIGLPQLLASLDVKKRHGEENHGERQHQRVLHRRTPRSGRITAAQGSAPETPMSACSARTEKAQPKSILAYNRFEYRKKNLKNM
jgi:hypothetical protein